MYFKTVSTTIKLCLFLSETSNVFFGIVDASRVAIVGGNCNNGANCGFRYVNVNNTASNTNWNIGASPIFFLASLHASIIPCPLAKMNFIRRAAW